MPYYGSVNVIDRSGWSKSYNLEKSLLMVGSAAVNDIVLPLDRGSGVASIHLQVLHPQIDQSRVRVVNLANSAASLKKGATGENVTIPANGTGDVEDGDAISLGDFTLAFSIQSQNGFTGSARSDHMGLKLELPGLQLKIGNRLAGRITVSNYGDQKRCQFEIELEGLPADCYQIDPVPFLFPKGEETLQIRLYHRGNRPPAGSCPVQLRATAPGTYPTEEVLLPVQFEVMPVYRYDVSIEGSHALEAAAVPRPVTQAVVGIERPNTGLPPAEPLATAAGKLAPEMSGLTSEPQPAPAAALPQAIAPSPRPVESALNPAATESPVPAPAEKAPAAQEVDWWASAQNLPTSENRPEPPANPSQARKPRLPLKGQPIQVLKTPQEPPESGSGQTPPDQDKEGKQP